MRQTFYFLLLSFSLACCTQMDQMERSDYSVIKYEIAGYAEFDRFHPLLADYKDLFVFFDKELIFKVAAISYPTVDPSGAPVEASGLVFHPINKKSRGVIDFLPSAHMDSEGGGTDEMYAEEAVLILMGYTVIMPDLIGSGISKEKYMPFLMAENTGRVAYDMRRAAAQYLWDEFRYPFPSETIIMGYSLGGSAALATQKYYETYHSNTVKVTKVFAGGGVYDLPTAFDVFAQTGIATYPAIPKTILAFKHYYFDLIGRELDLGQIFIGDLLTNCEEWFSGAYRSGEIRRMIGTDLHAYMHPDFFKPSDQQNDEFKKLQPFLKENSVTQGWIPKAPIYLTHAREDNLAPVECAEAAVKKLREVGANISLRTYPGDHMSVAIFFFIRNILRFL
ncbi:MAG: hypothetical protein FWG54_05360 [Bacteroidetes bacterium]|nr:hypothetical protein [Bacteroidota bacterium]